MTEQISYKEVIERLDEIKLASGLEARLRVAVLRNAVLDSVLHYLTYYAAREDVYLDLYQGEYDNAAQEAAGEVGTLYEHSPDLIILCLKLENLSPKLTGGFAGLAEEEKTGEIDFVMQNIAMIIAEIRKKSSAAVLVHNFEVPATPAYGILDYQEQTGQINTIRTMNLALQELVAANENVFVVDADLVQSRLGADNYFDNRYWHLAKAPFALPAAEALAREYVKYIRALRGKNRKCLVADCDNTLWGGIIGEDGINGLKLGKSYPGSAYLELQQAIMSLYQRGVILAVCSKNNREDVLEVLNEHPEMLLRREHFAAMAINWESKVDNLKTLAKEINIGLASMVLLEDSEFEAEMVRKMLPEVEVILLPRDSSQYKAALAGVGIFDTLQLLEEDRCRGEMYVAESKRKEMSGRIENIEDYYRQLEMVVTVRQVDKMTLPRAVQLSQRTNQFNLTTQRYSEPQMKEMMADPDCELLCLRLEDRFGDGGITGLAVLRTRGNEAVIESFLLSCRILGRGIEKVLLGACLRKASENGCTLISGIYKPTEKNRQVADFYQKHGFKIMQESPEENRCSLKLTARPITYPDYFKSVNVEL